MKWQAVILGLDPGIQTPLQFPPCQVVLFINTVTYSQKLRFIVELRLKFEAQNPKHETSTNDRNRKFKTKSKERCASCFGELEHLNFGFVSNFDIRISNLLVVQGCLKESHAYFLNTLLNL